MSAILGIYARNGHLDPSQFQAMEQTFARFTHRQIHRVQYPGLCLLTATVGTQPSCTALGAGDRWQVAALGTIVQPGASLLSPAETLARAWSAQGEACLPGLEGAFTAVAYDPKAHQLFLCNDKFGMRPLFVHVTNQLIAFSNEFETLLELPGVEPSLNKEALADYYCLGTTLGEETLVRDIFNLRPASFLCARQDKWQQQQYWQANIPVDTTATIDEQADLITSILREVVQQLFDQLPDRRCLLSAGADSRLILSCLRDDQRASTLFATSQLNILPASEDRDMIGALALVERLQLKHMVFEIAFSERDFGPAYFDEVRHVRVTQIIGGWHGGEYLGGYCAKAAPLRRIPTNEQVDTTLQQVFRRRFRNSLSRHPLEHLQAQVASMEAEAASFQFQLQQLARGFFTDIYMGSRGTWLQPFEIVNQGYSPFWDSRFLTALLMVPFDRVADYSLYNRIFARCLPELTDIPSNSPLTQRSDSSIPAMTVGTEPKVAIKPKYQRALLQYKGEWATWRKGIYRWWTMRKLLQDGDAPTTLRFTDFEAWMRRFMQR